ncbi:reverse transcriptase [Phytophthora megakarya]|uniref:Reverse transcriptase n=1 Tax=Phytophthora megakarya TaxID=4795 RepID=A0A225WAM9_9STRA|nr:reverse transcriptase [Phytophthora megakarya]
MDTAAPSEKESHCKVQDDKPNLVILKVKSMTKRADSLRVLVDSGASNNLFDSNICRCWTSRRSITIATGAIVKTEKRVIRARFSYKNRVFVEELLVLDLDDKFDMVLGMPWLARHDTIIDWEKHSGSRRCLWSQRVERASCNDSGIKRVSGQGPGTSKKLSAVRRRGDTSVSTPGVNPRSISESRKFSAVRHRGDNGVSTPGVATHYSAVRRRGDDNVSTPGVDATSCVDGCKSPALKLACCRAAGLDDACPRVQEPAGGIKEHSSMAGPGRNASESRIHKGKRRRKHNTVRKSRSGTETLQGMSAGQTQEPTVAVETLNVLTQTCTGYQYRKMELENPPT